MPVLLTVPKMEGLFLRFSEVSQKICEYLDNESLMKCKEVSKVLKSTIDDQKHTWVRLIRNFSHIQDNDFPESWRPILTKSPMEILKQLGLQLKISKEKQYLNDFVCDLSPLNVTAWTGNLNLFETIYNRVLGRNPNFLFEATGAFQQAAYWGHSEICKFILDNIENKVLDINPNHGGTAKKILHFAVFDGHFEIVRLVIDNMDTKDYPRDRYGTTPLHEAAEFGHFEICKLLVENMNTEELPIDDRGRTPLHYAAQFGCFEICQFFMNNFEHQNQISDITGMTPLHTASLSDEDSIFNHEVFKLLVDDSSNKNPRDHEGITPLHYLATGDHVEAFQYIFDQVDEKNPMDIHGLTPLEYSVRYHDHQFNICKFIINAMEDKNPKVHDGPDADTLLHKSAFYGLLEIHEYVMDLVQDKNPKNKDGNTPLHFAALKGNSAIIQLILKNVVEKNPSNNDGQTPFDLASDGDKKMMYEAITSRNIFLEFDRESKKTINEEKS